MFSPVANPETENLQIILRVPASMDWLSTLCAAVREYCAALPAILNLGENSAAATKLRRITTNTLRFTNSSNYSNFVYSIELVLQEAATNIIRHGYPEGLDMLNEYLTLSVNTTELIDEQGIKRRAMVLELSDAAPPFDPTIGEVNNPAPGDLQESGYGLYLIRRLTDKLEYSRREERNFLKMVKFIS
jgi:serine/threonine-protein kinase RsbW